MTYREDFSLKSVKMKESRVFRDAIHGYIKVDYLPIWRLINSCEVQRLRRIKQLGGTYMVFQSAEHTRFVHSLGVYQVIRNMISLDQVKGHLSDYDKLCVLCAGLLHDIGHGPFSHAFESCFDLSHEDMTARMILEESEVHEILMAVDPHLPEDVAHIIQKKNTKPLLIQMVSSQLDGDRMDYLLRDSYCAGVTYGQFDMSRILRTMRIKDNRIVFKESGVQAIENYILARYHMYWQVYYHPTARSYEHLLHSIIMRIKDLYQEGYQFSYELDYLMPFLKNEVSVKDYLQLDESVMFYYFKRCIEDDDEILSDLCARFLNRRLFKYKSYETKEDLTHIQDVSLDKGFEPRYYVTSDDAKQIPYKHYGVIGHLEEIEILQPNGKVIPLPETSEIVQAILSAKAKQDKKVFFVKEIASAL